MGRGFFKNQVCGGYGDPCIGTPATGCTGVRDADFAQHVSGLPHGINWILANCPGGGGGPCGREVHCEGQTAAEVGLGPPFRDLRAAPFNFDENTALELATRLGFLGQQSVTSWYTCNPAGGGCGATGGYMLFLAADDDNGDINDGTPHMTAIRGAFERHQMHCATPAVVNSGCAGGPTAAPTVTVTPMDKGAQRELDGRGGRRALQRLPHRGRERLLLRQGQGRRDERPHLPGLGPPERPDLLLLGPARGLEPVLLRAHERVRHRGPRRRSQPRRSRATSRSG